MILNILALSAHSVTTKCVLPDMFGSRPMAGIAIPCCFSTVV